MMAMQAPATGSMPAGIFCLAASAEKSRPYSPTEVRLSTQASRLFGSQFGDLVQEEGQLSGRQEGFLCMA